MRWICYKDGKSLWPFGRGVSSEASRTQACRRTRCLLCVPSMAAVQQAPSDCPVLGLLVDSTRLQVRLIRGGGILAAGTTNKQKASPLPRGAEQRQAVSPLFASMAWPVCHDSAKPWQHSATEPVHHLQVCVCPIDASPAAHLLDKPPPPQAAHTDKKVVESIGSSFCTSAHKRATTTLHFSYGCCNQVGRANADQRTPPRLGAGKR